MIVVDVNVLLAALRADHVFHARATRWLRRALKRAASGEEMIEILPIVAASVLRLATNRRVFPQPTPAALVLGFLDTLLGSPGVAMSEVGKAEWLRLRELAERRDLTGNRVPDGLIAACALTLDARLATFDRGFRRLLPPRHLALLGP